MAREGLSRWEVDSGDADRLMEIIERRCVDQVNGASWQAAAFHRLYDRLDRQDALREMTVRYREHMHSNEPVHTWPLPTLTRMHRRHNAGPDARFPASRRTGTQLSRWTRTRSI